MHREAISTKLPAARFLDENDVDAAKAGLAAWNKLLSGDTVKEAMPLYLRPSQAERLAKEKK